MDPALKPQLTIVFHDRILELSEANLPELRDRIAAHHPYTAVATGTRPLTYLLEGRGPVGYPPVRADRFDPAQPSTYVPYAQDEVLLRNILSGRFGLRVDEEPTGHSHPPQSQRPDDPKDKKRVKEIEERAGDLVQRNQALDRGLLDRTLEELGDIGRIAGRPPRVVFHEPHHDLTPGMLLTDELFRRIVADVGVVLARHAAGQWGQAQSVPSLLGLLQAFVAGLNRTVTAPDVGSPGALGLQYADFIDATAVGRPTRIEVVQAAGRAVAASVVVGAWRGGTHSDGSTIHR